MAKRISIINFKGGVGKTTLAFHLGTGLARYHNARVLLIDMDHQSSLSILCLESAGWERAVAGRRVVDEVYLTFTGGRNALPGRDIIVDRPMAGKSYSYNQMSIVPASLQLDNIEIELTASHQGDAVQSEWNKRTLLCRWIEETGIDDEYEYIIFDCPPATKIVSQNAIAASHGYVIPVVPEAVMDRGAPHLYEMMRTGIDDRLKRLVPLVEPRAIHVPDTQLVGLVITRIQVASGGYVNDHRQHLASLQRLWQGSLLMPFIVQGVGVTESLTSGRPVYDFGDNQNVGDRGLHQQYMELTTEVKRRIDAL